MKRTVHVILYVLFVSNCFAQSFIPGNFVVLRIGSGADTLVAGTAQPVFLDEYNPCGGLVRSIPMPVAVSGDHKRLTLPISTTDYTEGYLSLSQDGGKLALAGYDAAPGTTGVSAISATTVKRVVAVVHADGTVNTSTALSAFSGQAVRAAVIDGANIWVSGGSGGIMYTTLGGTSHLQITNATARSLMVSNGQLYASSTSGSYRLTSVGTGLPVTAGQIMVNLPGLPATGSPYQYLIVNAGSGSDVLYLAHDNLLRKYSLSGGAWVSNGAIGVASDKYRAVTGALNANGTVTLYAIRRNDNATSAGGEIVTLTDNTGYNSDFSATVPTVIIKANEQNVFRSIVMAPEAVTVNAQSRKSETDSISLRLSPNGAQEQVVVTFNNAHMTNPSIVLTSAAGQVVRRIPPASLHAGKVTVDVRGLAKGVYYVTLSDGKKQTTKKLLVL